MGRTEAKGQKSMASWEDGEDGEGGAWANSEAGTNAAFGFPSQEWP